MFTLLMFSVSFFLPPALSYPFFPLSSTQFPPPAPCDSYVCSKGSTSTDLLSTCLIHSNITSKTGNYSLYTGIGCKNLNLHNNFCDLSRLILNDSSTYNVKCTSPASNYTLLYPGEKPCWSNSGCINNNCIDNTCTGLPLGGTCGNNYECQAGLSCQQNIFTDIMTCEDLIRPNGVNCSTDTDCVNNAGCDYDSVHYLGVCRDYFSVNVGEIVLKCDNYVNMLCKHLQCAPDQNSTFKCVEPSVGKKSLVQCQSGKECLDKSSKYYSQCTCGVNEGRKSFCQPFPGDEVTVGLLGILKTWVSSKSILACSSDQRWGFKCMMKWEAKLYDKIKYHMLMYLNYTAIQENSDCVKDIFTYMYWDTKEDSKISSLAGALKTFWALAVFLGY